MIESLILVGDSIRISYQPYVAVRLRDIAVWGPEANCRSSRHLLANLDSLVLRHLSGPSLVHLNAGAHDLRRYPNRGYDVAVNLDEYRKNMAAIVTLLRNDPHVGAVIVATTTPVDDVRHEEMKDSRRRNADVIEYNRALVEIAMESGAVVNDLYTAARTAPFDTLSADGIHLNEPGKEFIAGRVASFVRPYLPAAP